MVCNSFYIKMVNNTVGRAEGRRNDVTVQSMCVCTRLLLQIIYGSVVGAMKLQKENYKIFWDDFDVGIR